MDATTAALAWAAEEFGSATLGDARRVARLVQVAAGAATRPAGTVTEVFADGAARQGAYGLLCNDAVAVEDVAAAAHRACARRCADLPFVYVPLDESGLTITDRARAKGTGKIGAHRFPTRGFKVLTAQAVAPDGTPVGLCGQRWWARRGRKRTHHHRRSRAQKESRHWADVVAYLDDLFRTEAPGCTPWPQLDRGGDIGFVLVEAVDRGHLLTVRAAANRRLGSGAAAPYLWPHLQRQPVRGYTFLAVPALPARRARTARLAVRAAQVTLVVTDRRTSHQREVTLHAVWAKEVHTTPAGERPIEWMLLTTYPVEDFVDACVVLDGYATRWLAEEFHNTWKSGLCHVEETQLHAAARIQKWATVLASVAMRALRLSRLARTQPALPASQELTRDEIDATILLRRPAGYKPGDTPTLGEVVRWIADEGGYTGKSSGGPPGKIVIGRGLERIRVAAEVLERLRTREM